jgi:hypothetical protein
VGSPILVQGNGTMRRSTPLMAIALFFCGNCGWAVAQWPAAKHNTHVDFARNNVWPQPFRGQDAASTVAPFEIMKRNGWRDNNTVGSVLFEKNQLTDAGRLKVATLLASTPSNYRTLYVQTGETQEETLARVQSVQSTVSTLVTDGQMPAIQITSAAPSSSPGAYQNLVHRAIQKTTPTPRLPVYSGMANPAQTSVAPQDQE